MTEAQIIEVCARRLQGQSWKTIAEAFPDIRPRKLRRMMNLYIFEGKKPA